MDYTATLDGRTIASGDAQAIQTAVSTALTDFLAQDPDGVAMSAQNANQAFSSGLVERSVRAQGQWSVPLWVHGQRHTITVSGEA